MEKKQINPNLKNSELDFFKEKIFQIEIYINNMAFQFDDEETKALILEQKKLLESYVEVTEKLFQKIETNVCEIKNK